ncbi:MAG: hypothetical protein JWL63_3313 [Rhodocyclales bacterium]|nr:hypothetical protein [Rhodocyclales bacterium]
MPVGMASHAFMGFDRKFFKYVVIFLGPLACYLHCSLRCAGKLCFLFWVKWIADKNSSHVLGVGPPCVLTIRKVELWLRRYRLEFLEYCLYRVGRYVDVSRKAQLHAPYAVCFPFDRNS